MKRRTTDARSQTLALPLIRVESMILHLREQKEMLDDHLAQLYEVETRVLTQAVKRNLERSPPGCIFQLTHEESRNLRSQFVTSSWGCRRYLPFAFTEQGVAMLSSVLRSRCAVQVNVEIVRAFVRLRRLAASDADLEKKYNAQFSAVFDAIRQLMEPAPVPPKRRIGFSASAE